MSARHLLVLAIFVSACGGPSKPPAAPATQIAAATQPAAGPPCPDQAKLAAELERMWQVAPLKIELAGCTPGQFGRPGWLVMAYIDEYDPGESEYPSHSTLRRVVFAEDFTVIAEAEPESLAPWYRAEGGGPGHAEVVDFDGDGVHEVFDRHFAAHGGSTTNWLLVRRIEGTALATILEVEYAESAERETDEGEFYDSTCDSTVELVPAPDGRGRLLVLTTEGDSDRCPLTYGKHTYEIVDGKMVER